eukprot:3938938-Pleurochrysis_carterae.AAC.1
MAVHARESTPGSERIEYSVHFGQVKLVWKAQVHTCRWFQSGDDRQRVHSVLTQTRRKFWFEPGPYADEAYMVTSRAHAFAQLASAR